MSIAAIVACMFMLPLVVLPSLTHVCFSFTSRASAHDNIFLIFSSKQSWGSLPVLFLWCSKNAGNTNCGSRPDVAIWNEKNSCCSTRPSCLSPLGYQDHALLPQVCQERGPCSHAQGVQEAGRVQGTWQPAVQARLIFWKASSCARLLKTGSSPTLTPCQSQSQKLPNPTVRPRKLCIGTQGP